MSAKSIHRPDSISEIGAQSAKLAARRSRYDLTAVAQRVLYDPGKTAAEQHRTVWCHRAIKAESGQCHLWRRLDGSSSRLTSAVTCGSVWTCPVCSARVAERLERAMVFHGRSGGNVYLLTLTAPHDRALALADFERLLSKALQRFKNSRTYKAVSKRYQRAGSVRSLELTWGTENGWHLHTHDLIFAAPGLDADLRSIDELRLAWVTAVVKVGLAPQSKVPWMMEYALDLRGGDAAGDYVTKFGHDLKWGVTSEITRSHAKIGLRAVCGLKGSATPFQILAWAGEGDGEAVMLFRDYAEATKGKRMLYWSPNLKSKMGVGDDTDEAVAGDDEPRPEEREVASLDAQALALIWSRRALGELLEYVCLITDPDPAHVQACVNDFLDELRCRPRIGKGTVRQKLWRLPTFHEVELAA
jgi:hypothetical protein